MQDSRIYSSAIDSVGIYLKEVGWICRFINNRPSESHSNKKLFWAKDSLRSVFYALILGAAIRAER